MARRHGRPDVRQHKSATEHRQAMLIDNARPNTMPTWMPPDKTRLATSWKKCFVVPTTCTKGCCAFSMAQNSTHRLGERPPSACASSPWNMR